MSPFDRFALCAALAAIPDGRPLTRWKVKRGALIRSRQQALTPRQQKLLLRGLGGFQAAMVSLGVALYAQIRWRPLSVLLLAGVVGYLAWSLVSFFIRMV